MTWDESCMLFQKNFPEGRFEKMEFLGGHTFAYANLKKDNQTPIEERVVVTYLDGKVFDYYVPKQET